MVNLGQDVLAVSTFVLKRRNNCSFFLRDTWLGGEKLKKKNPIICVLLIVVMASSCLLTQSVAADQPGYQNITVQQAKHLINHTPNLFILDVRNQSEYNLGHLYGAFIVPLDQIQNWNWNSTTIDGQPFIDILQAHINNTVLVYCKGGSRSAPACQILADHGFTKVYNMQDGITAWMQAEYPIYTAYHHVSVDMTNDEPVIQIDPYLLYQSTCTTCQNQTCASTSTMQTNTTKIQESQNSTTWRIELSSNETTVELLVTKTLLLSQTEMSDGYNRTLALSLIQSTTENASDQVYELKYTAKSNTTNLIFQTSLTPNVDQTYNNSLTMVSYSSTEIPYSTSKEIVDFNTSSISLSQEYKALSTATKQLARTYERAKDSSLQQLADHYRIVSQEAKYLSRLVHHDFSDFDREITNNTRVLMGIGQPTSDPNAAQNGDFTNSLDYWSTTGTGQHSLVYNDYSTSPSSLLLGWRDYGPTTDARDMAYQLIYIPEEAVNIHLYFYYHLYSYDGPNDIFEAYVARYGGNPMYVFGRAGITRGYLDDFGWTEGDSGYLDYTYYAGSSVYVYFDVYNRYDNQYNTWAYLDHVELLYDNPPPDYIACMSLCVANFCQDQWYICDWICGSTCYACAFTGLSCIPCAVCLAGMGAYCFIICSL